MNFWKMRPLVFWALLLWVCVVAGFGERRSTFTTTLVPGRGPLKIARGDVLQAANREISDVEIERKPSRRVDAEKITLSDEPTTTTDADERGPTPVIQSDEDSEQKPAGLSVDTRIGIGIGGGVAGIVLVGGIIYVWTGRRRKQPEPIMTQISWDSYHHGGFSTKSVELDGSWRPSIVSNRSDISISKPPPARFPAGYGGWPVELPVQVHR